GVPPPPHPPAPAPPGLSPPPRAFIVYGLLKHTVGLRLTQEEEFDGADLSIHKISATPDREVSW
ncbi:MAG: hypothetical protein K0M68_17135, partial [Acidovorax sp.]|nr:hypothetical protein [Acidovorax sp.]